MAERFSDRNSGYRFIALALLIPAVLAGLLDSKHMLDPWSKTAWLVYTCALVAVILCFLPYTEIESTDEGFRVRRGPGRGRRIRWREIASTRVSAHRAWVKRGKYSAHKLELTHQFTLTPSEGKPVVMGSEAPLHQIAEYANASTPHLPYEWKLDTAGERTAIERNGEWAKVLRAGVTAPPAPARAADAQRPRDGDTIVKPGSGGITTRNRLILLAATTAIAAYYAPWDPTDPNGVTVWWIMACLPAMFIGPLALWAIWSDFGPPSYRLSSQGGAFTVARKGLGRGATMTGDWSRVTGTRYDIGTTSQKDEFVVEMDRTEPLVFGGASGYPKLLAWFNQRAALPYEWVPAANVDMRRVREVNGPYARVVVNGGETTTAAKVSTAT